MQESSGAPVVADVSLDDAPHVADRPTPRRTWSGRTSSSSWNGALADLSPDKREAFVLKHVEGLSYEEMAAVTGERIPTLKMRVHRAREELLKVLEDHA